MCLKDALGMVLYLFNFLLSLLSLLVIAFAAYIMYVINVYQDQINEKVVGDISFGRITQGVLILGIISFLSCIFACCAVKRKSTKFALIYLIFMGFLFIIEIVVGIVSVTVASDNLKTIRASLTDKTEGLKSLSDTWEKYSQVASAILLATAVSQFFCIITMWWYRRLISNDLSLPAPPPAPPADAAVTTV